MGRQSFPHPPLGDTSGPQLSLVCLPPEVLRRCRCVTHAYAIAAAATRTVNAMRAFSQSPLMANPTAARGATNRAPTSSRTARGCRLVVVNAVSLLRRLPAADEMSLYHRSQAPDEAYDSSLMCRIVRVSACAELPR